MAVKRAKTAASAAPKSAGAAAKQKTVRKSASAAARTSKSAVGKAAAKSKVTASSAAARKSASGKTATAKRSTAKTGSAAARTTKAPAGKRVTPAAARTRATAKAASKTAGKQAAKKVAKTAKATGKTAKAAAKAPARTRKPARPVSQALGVVEKALDDMKALNIKVLDVARLTDITDTMVIASGSSDRHVRSIASRIVEQAKQAGLQPAGVEGERDGEWVLVDLHEVIVHVMLPRVREFYRLESLWDISAARREAAEAGA